MSGTDTSVPGVLSRPSSQVELSLLVEAGLMPAQALRAATINAATMLGRATEQGSITAGKLADMVMLDADPLADISNLRRVNRVFKGGVPYDPARLARDALTATPLPSARRPACGAGGRSVRLGSISP